MVLKFDPFRCNKRYSVRSKGIIKGLYEVLRLTYGVLPPSFNIHTGLTGVKFKIIELTY